MNVAARGVGLALWVALAGCTPVPPPPIETLSFNVRYGTADDGDNRWPYRQSQVIATIGEGAHLIGIQEALHFQVEALRTALPHLHVVGVGRQDGDTLGEYAAVLVDTARFEVVDRGTFWFSDTPDVPGSVSWGNRITRICTWVRLVDRASGDTLRVYNVHWDHESQPSRERSADLLMTRVAGGPAADGVVVLGDFNAGEDNPAFQRLLDPGVGLVDTYRAVHPNDSIVGTFHAFAGTDTGAKIDAILVGSRFVTDSAAIDRRAAAGRYPSDHFPVRASVRWRDSN